MSQFIKSVHAKGIHGRFDIEMEFQDGVNIIFGRNGTGKTTLLHILANAVNADFERFVYLAFEEIDLGLEDEIKIHIEQQIVPEPDLVKISAWIDNSPPVSITLGEVLTKRNLEARRRTESIEKKLLSTSPKTGLRATYFPAFRTMMEAWGSVSEREYRITGGSRTYSDRQPERATAFARGLFGNFVPALTFPSLLEIEQQLNSEVAEALFRVARSDEALLSNALIEAFAATSQDYVSSEAEQDPEIILENISRLSDQLQKSLLQSAASPVSTVYSRLQHQLASFRLRSEEATIAKRILAVYQNTLRKRLDEQTLAFTRIEGYLESVNQFLEGKKLVVEHRKGRNGLPEIGIKHTNDRIDSLQTLSSGERQVVSLIYAATHMEKSNIVLIDEPEISLNIDWQRSLLPALIGQLPAKQVIVCTHSSIIGAEYDERMKELIPKATIGRNMQRDLRELREIEIDEDEEIPF
jgi:ABC-type cobalamin/Fe3+-siderophores transport system ATPase subunit